MDSDVHLVHMLMLLRLFLDPGYKSLNRTECGLIWLHLPYVENADYVAASDTPGWYTVDVLPRGFTETQTCYRKDSPKLRRVTTGIRRNTDVVYPREESEEYELYCRFRRSLPYACSPQSCVDPQRQYQVWLRTGEGVEGYTKAQSQYYNRCIGRRPR